MSKILGKKKFKVPIYGRIVRIVVTKDIKLGLRSVDVDADEEDNTMEGCVVEGSDGIINLVIRPKSDINTITHEAFHITTGILSDAGLKLCDNSEEAYAYLIGFICEKICDTIRNIKK